MTTPLSRMLALVIVALLLITGQAEAQFGLSEPSVDDLVNVEVTADVERIVPGKTFHVAVVCRIASQWHIYWKNPGDSGVQTDIAITAPDLYQVGAMRFPRPKRYNTLDGINNGYSREVVFLVPVTAPTMLEPGTESFKVDVNFLVCKEKCFIGNATKTLTLETVFEQDADPGKPSDLIAKHLPRFPKPIKALKGAKMAFDGKTLTITGPAGEVDRARFFPVPMDGVNFEDARTSISDGQFEIIVPVDVDPAASLGKPLKIEGLIALGKRSSDPSYEFVLPLDENGG